MADYASLICPARCASACVAFVGTALTSWQRDGHASLSRGLSAPRVLQRAPALAKRGDGAPRGATRSSVHASAVACEGVAPLGAPPEWLVTLRAYLRRSLPPALDGHSASGRALQKAFAPRCQRAPRRRAVVPSRAEPRRRPGARLRGRARGRRTADGGISPALGPGRSDAASPASALPAVPLARRLMKRPSADR